jgi:hypothetical protein
VITIGASCYEVRSATRPVSRHRPAHVAPPRPPTPEPAASAPAPAAPVAYEAAPIARPPASSPHTSRAATRPPAPEPKLDPPAAATKVADFVAAASPASLGAPGGPNYGLLLALLLATLGAAAAWSYSAAHPRRYWRAR